MSMAFGKSRRNWNSVWYGIFLRVFGLEWPDSLWFNLTAAGIIGFLYALYLRGPASLNPHNINWLRGDAATYQIGWTLFRQDPHLHWPLTYTDRVGFPIGTSISLMDVNPLFALLLRPFSRFLPDPFQYLGIESVIACALQFFFASRIFRLVLSPSVLTVALPSVFFLISPPMAWRLGGHYALANHWLLTAALLVFFTAYRRSPISTKRLVLTALALGGISVSINPYLAFQVLLMLATTVAGLVWSRRLALSAAIGVLAGLGATSVLAAYIFGFIIPGGQGYGAIGYRYYSLNLLSPFDPNMFGSFLFRALPTFVFGQYEGYSYLGAGVMLLALAGALILLLRRPKIYWSRRSWWVPLLFCCLFLTLMALSTRITAGSKLLVDLDPHEKLSPYLATLRSSGRLFWLPYYTMLVAVLAIPYSFLSRRWANLLVAFALAIQLADLVPLRRSVHAGLNTQFAQPLRSPVWSTLGSRYENLIIMPAWQCGPDASPGGVEGDVIFGMLAAAQKMRINSYDSARRTAASSNFHCVESIASLTREPLSPKSAYVVTPTIAVNLVASGRGRCHYLDGFILCSATNDFGLGSNSWGSRTEFWVRAHFQTILLRDPTGPELTTWTKALNEGTKSAANFVEDLLSSAEFEHNCLPRFWRYLDTQGRWPTLAEWVSNNSPQPRTSSAGATGQPVLHDRNRAIVCMLYFAVLQRDPASTDLAGWGRVLAQTSVRHLIPLFFGSAEYASHRYLDYR